jgi:alpha-glucosidase
VGESSKNLFARWISIGTFSPFFRGHTMINTRDAEPWSFGEEVEQIARNFIKLRYKLLPYIYSLFYEASVSGMPIQRSLVLDYTHNPQIYDHQFHNQYLFGPSILVAPVESYKEIMKVYLPQGDWYCFYTGLKYQGNQEIFVECPIHKIAVFVKAGSIIPSQLALSNTSQKSEISIVHIYNGADNSFLHYEDDGESYNYLNEAFYKRKITYNSSENKIVFDQSEGSFTPAYKRLKIILHSFSTDFAIIHNQQFTLAHEVHSFFSPLEKYDPFSEPDSMGEENVKAVEFDFSTTKIEILLK